MTPPRVVLGLAHGANEAALLVREQAELTPPNPLSKLHARVVELLAAVDALTGAIVEEENR